MDSIGTHSPWISRLFSELGHEVIVANARKVRLIGENRRMRCAPTNGERQAASCTTGRSYGPLRAEDTRCWLSRRNSRLLLLWADRQSASGDNRLPKLRRLAFAIVDRRFVVAQFRRPVGLQRRNMRAWATWLVA